MKHQAFTAVIGGGAAGLCAAIKAAENHPEKRIIVLEKAERVGKKLLVTGNGRCNLSNVNASFENYHGAGASDMINILFKKYNPAAVLDFFQKRGLMTRVDEAGRVYPLTGQASSVLDVLRKSLEKKNVAVFTDFSVTGIDPMKNGYQISGKNDTVFAEKVIVATGGGFDYAFRKSDNRALFSSLSLSATPLFPALSPVFVSEDITKMLKGIRARGAVALEKNGAVIKREAGEIQFGDHALSGICVFDLSREINRENGDTVIVSLLPDYSLEEIKAILHERFSLSDTIADSFIGMFHKNIALAMLKTAGIAPLKKAKEISEDELSAIADVIFAWRFSAKKKSDLKNAQVTAGGVRLDEIDPDTFESKKYKNLFIVGEALDIDGDCGGYNLQFAFSSGLCAGESV